VGKAGARDVSGRSVPRWHWGFVGVVIFSLVVTLATRTFHSTTLQSTTVHFSSPQAMRQHMDSDAVGWVSPASEIAAEQPPTFYARMAPAGLPLPTFHIEENLYNRPPPTCWLFLLHSNVSHYNWTSTQSLIRAWTGCSFAGRGLSSPGSGMQI